MSRKIDFRWPVNSQQISLNRTFNFVGMMAWACHMFKSYQYF